MNPQNTAVAVTSKPSAIKLMASKLNVESEKLFECLKSTCFKGATNEEMLALIVVANQYDLNPLLKEIYAFPAKGGGIVPVISVDGFNKMMVRDPNFDGLQFEFANDANGNLESCTGTAYLKDRSHPVRITEYLDECKRNTDPWNNMPRRMLRNRTLCQLSRIAFGFSGVKDEDEAIDIIADVEPQPLKLPPNPELKPSEAKPNPAFKMTLNAPAGDGIHIINPQPPAEQKTSSKPVGPHQEMEAFLAEGGFTFDQFRFWLIETGNDETASSKSEMSEFDGKLLTRLLKAKTGLAKGLFQAKEAGK